jgi:glycosyltransferase involved in cell wall biosynthesis
MTPITIDPIPAGVKRPLWSVMIPTYNCARYLGDALRSVLQQDLGPDRMQIEVVDDVSTNDDPEEVVKALGKGRVSFYRQPRNDGAIANFNGCINRSSGELVHILHGDDLVADGFYQAIEKLAETHPDVGLYATRIFFVDEEAIITGVSRRVPELEAPSRIAAPFFYKDPMQFAGIAVRRRAYEQVGGFRPDLVHTADCEMWARVTSACGSVMTSNVLAYYRIFSANDSGRLARTAENIHDIRRLSSVFADSYPGFSRATAARAAAALAWKQYRRFKRLGDENAARANYEVWADLTPPAERALQRLRGLARGLQRRVVS